MSLMYIILGSTRNYNYGKEIVRPTYLTYNGTAQICREGRKYSIKRR